MSPEPCREWLKLNRRTHPAPTPTAPLMCASAAPCNITAADIASFRALGVEICFHSGELGEFWLVPSYTSQRRKEITPEHVVTIGRVLAAFSGARVTAFQPASPVLKGSST